MYWPCISGETYLKTRLFSAPNFCFRRFFMRVFTLKLTDFFLARGVSVNLFQFYFVNQTGSWQIFIGYLADFYFLREDSLKTPESCREARQNIWAYFFDNQQTFFRFIDDFPPKGSRDGPKFCASSISCHVSAILALFFFLGFMMSKSDWFLARIEM